MCENGLAEFWFCTHYGTVVCDTDLFRSCITNLLLFPLANNTVLGAVQHVLLFFFYRWYEDGKLRGEWLLHITLFLKVWLSLHQWYYPDTVSFQATWSEWIIIVENCSVSLFLRDNCYIIIIYCCSLISE